MIIDKKNRKSRELLEIRSAKIKRFTFEYWNQKVKSLNLESKIKKRKRTSAKINFGKKDHKIKFVDMISGYEAALGMFESNSLFDCIDKIKQNEIKIFFDWGCNDASTSIWGHDHFSNAKIYSIDPNPKAVKIAKKNTKKLDRINIELAAIGVTQGIIKFGFDDNWSMGGSTRWISEKDNWVDVIQFKADSYLREKTSGFEKEEVVLKIDIEGAEIELFKNKDFLKELRKSVGYLLIETHGSFEYQKSLSIVIEEIYPEKSTILTQGCQERLYPNNLKIMK